MFNLHYMCDRFPCILAVCLCIFSYSTALPEKLLWPNQPYWIPRLLWLLVWKWASAFRWLNIRLVWHLPKAFCLLQSHYYQSPGAVWTQVLTEEANLSPALQSVKYCNLWGLSCWSALSAVLSPHLLLYIPDAWKDLHQESACSYVSGQKHTTEPILSPAPEVMTPIKVKHFSGVFRLMPSMFLRAICAKWLINI